MKLSEAMRKGSRMAKQSFGKWTDGPGSGCALMLTAIGLGMRSHKNPSMGLAHGYVAIPAELHGEYPALKLSCEMPCDHFDGSTVTLWETILHMNDTHQWSAERIAGWIEATIETPTYSMLDVQRYIGDPIESEVPRV